MNYPTAIAIAISTAVIVIEAVLIYMVRISSKREAPIEFVLAAVTLFFWTACAVLPLLRILFS